MESFLSAALAGFSSGALVAVLAGFFFKTLVSPYLLEKAKNLATREDIGEITDKVELVRHGYNEILENLRAKQQLRIAAVDRRLQAHQEAFTHWRSLVDGEIEIGKAVVACQEWWVKNCLYLEPSVRKSFVSSYMAAHARMQFIRAGSDAEYIMESWKTVMSFPDTLFSAIQLPPLSAEEKEFLQNDGKASITSASGAPQ